MDVGAAGHLIIFFSIMVAEILISFFVLAYAGYSFLVTFVNTAAGNDEIQWPGDPLQDWLFKGIYLIWLMAVWAVPATFLTSFLRPPPALYLPIVLGIVWLFFPITVLSSLSGGSFMVVFRPVILGLMLKHAGKVLGFYLLTGLIGLICGALLYYGVVLSFLLLFPAAILGAAGFLIYARQLGRVAWLITWKDSKSKKKSDPKPPEANQVEIVDPWSSPEDKSREPRNTPRPPRSRDTRLPLKKKKPRGKPSSKAYDPWAEPDTEPQSKKRRRQPAAEPEDPLGPTEGTYELQEGVESAVPQPTAMPKGGLPNSEQEGYAVTPLAMSASITPPPPASPVVSKLEEELAAPRKQAPPPRNLLTGGVYSFPFYPTTLASMLMLALGFWGVAALANALVAMWP